MGCRDGNSKLSFGLDFRILLKIYLWRCSTLCVPPPPATEDNSFYSLISLFSLYYPPKKIDCHVELKFSSQ